MVRFRGGENATNAPPPPSARKICDKKRRRAALCIIGVVSGVATMLSHIAPSLDKKPIHTSALTGELWVKELLAGKWHSFLIKCSISLNITQGHPERCRRQLGMNRHVFKRLLRELERNCGLCSTKYVSAAEQLAIFLRMARSGEHNRDMQEHFQRGGATISRYISWCFHYL